jgi:hypothetical protein
MMSDVYLYLEDGYGVGLGITNATGTFVALG